MFSTEPSQWRYTGPDCTLYWNTLEEALESAMKFIVNSKETLESRTIEIRFDRKAVMVN